MRSISARTTITTRNGEIRLQVGYPVPTDPRANMRAAVLAGSISTTTIEATALHRRQGPPVVRPADRQLPPLDLRIEPFRYRLSAGSIEAVRPALGAICTVTHRSRARR